MHDDEMQDQGGWEQVTEAGKQAKAGMTEAAKRADSGESEARPDEPGYIQKQLEALISGLKYKEIAEYVQLMNRPAKLIWNNLLSGIARGVGIALGFTVFLVTSLYVLRALGALNLPIVGDYIADIVKIVQAQLEGRAIR